MNGFRRGWTLVEMAICLTIGALVFGTAVDILAVAMQADVSGGRAAESLQSVDRLAEQFSADVRSAIDIRTVAPAKAATSWSMRLPDDRRIEYALQDHALLRTAYQADKVAEREAFALGDELTARLELQPAAHSATLPADKPTQATLVLERTADGTSPSIEAMQIAVPIGWDRRFSATAKGEKNK